MMGRIVLRHSESPPQVSRKSTKTLAALGLGGDYVEGGIQGSR